MASTEIRDRRRTLRYRGLLVKQMVQMKNRVSGLLLKKGVTHTKRRLHKVGYFAELMAGLRVFQTYGEDRAREALAACIEQRFVIQAALPGYGKSVEL